MRTKILALGCTVLLTGLALSGCGEPSRSVVERGKECFDAGGSWTHDGWSGYKCEFRR